MKETESKVGGRPGRGRRGHWDLPGSLILLTLPLIALAPSALFLIALGGLLLSFVFALFENALLHYSSARLMAGARERGQEERMTRALADEDEVLLASKIARGLTQIVAVVVFALALVEVQPSTAAAIVWSTVALILFLLFQVAMPYVLARRAGHTILLRGLVPYRIVVAVFRPLATLLHGGATRLFRNGGEPDRSAEITDEILSAVEEGNREGVLEETERHMIEGVIDLRGISVDHIMTPRTEMIAIAADGTIETAVAKSTEHGLSRLPVYRGTPDSIIGVLYVKDLLPYITKKDAPPALSEILRPPFFVPESKIVGQLLNEMKAKKIHMAIVLDEYGGTAGVVTIEDILEEIVGEIEDEHEREATRSLVRINENAATVDGRTHIDDLNEAMHISVPESEEYETVGGLLFSHLGRVPAVGENMELNGVRLTVLEADARCVNRVKVTIQRTG